MVKAYLRYEPEGALGVITSAPAIAYVLDGPSTTASGGGGDGAWAAAARTPSTSTSSSSLQHRRQRRLLVAAGSLESVALWDASTGALVAKLEPTPSPATGARAREVTTLATLVGGGGRGGARGGGADDNDGGGGGGNSSFARPLLAAGHADGRVRLWDVGDRRMEASLAGHSSAVTCLAFDDGCYATGNGDDDDGVDGDGDGSGGFAAGSGSGGNLLASGGADTDVVVWDVGSESGVCRLRGHAAPVTAVAFVVSRSGFGGGGASSSPSSSSPSTLLVASAAKDGCVRLWHLAAGGACVCTVATGSGELWALAPAPPALSRVFSSSSSSSSSPSLSGNKGDDRGARGGAGGGGSLLAGAGVGGEVLLWRVADVAAARSEGGDGEGEENNDAATTARSLPSLLPVGSLRRSAPDRAACLAWSVARDGGGGGGTPVLACASAGRVVDVWKARTAADARRHAARRARRRREKEAARNSSGGNGDAASTATASPVEIEASDALEALPALRPKHRVRAAAFCPPSSPSLASSAAAGGSKKSKNSSRLALALSNNVIEFWDVPLSWSSSASASASAPNGPGSPSPPPIAEAERAASIEGPGHRAPVRALALAPDGRLALAASGDGSAKLWNVETMSHVRSVEPLGSGEKGGMKAAAAGEGGALCALWAPGGRHAVVGAKAGSLWLVDAATGSAARLGEPSSSHRGPVWSLSALPDGSGFVSASADKDVKFWEWEVVPSSSAAAASPSVSARHVRSLRLADDALCAKVSPDGRYLAVSLLDSTIQVFHADSLKFALALYGHSLPALAFDISSDGALLVSGGADKTVRVWGLDFGDCHRSMRGHADSVTAVSFVPGTHHVFTASKDGTVRYWDADAWQSLLVLEGGCGSGSGGGGGGGGGASVGAELWCLSVSADGSLLLAGGADRAVRVWRRSDEPFFVEEENERRLESMFDDGAAADAAANAARMNSAGSNDGSAMAPGDATTAARPTAEALTAADELAEAMDLADEEDKRREAALEAAAAAAAEKHAAEAKKNKKNRRQIVSSSAAASSQLPASFQPNPLLLGLSPDAYVLRALRRVRPADLEAAALTLPLADALRLLSRVRSLLLRTGGGRKGGAAAAASSSSSPELLVRAATLLVRAHAPSLAGSRRARAALSRLRAPLRAAARAARDRLAENEAALRHLCRAARARGRV